MAILAKKQNGLQLTKDYKDLDDPVLLMIEPTGREKVATGFGPKRGWDEVVVTDADDVGRIGWFPWKSGRKCLVIWDLGEYAYFEE